jgi:fatty acid synthase subunit alpha
MHALVLTFLQERNETRIWNDILESIGRTSGNALPVMAQKSLIGS